MVSHKQDSDALPSDRRGGGEGEGEEVIVSPVELYYEGIPVLDGVIVIEDSPADGGGYADVFRGRWKTPRTREDAGADADADVPELLLAVKVFRFAWLSPNEGEGKVSPT